jgi:alpha-L-fucosidase
MLRIIQTTVFLCLCFPLFSQTDNSYKFPVPQYSPTNGNVQARENFQNMKCGLFVHWGIYSILGDGEWVMHNKKIPYNSYSRLASCFAPFDFNAKEWVAMVKNAGMKYITITARHHDGFSMFRSKASPYNIVDATPFKRDILKELSDECTKQGIKLHVYYSQLDWGRPDYGFGERIVNGKPEKANWRTYIDFMKAQLTELLTNYNVSGVWFDGQWERYDANWSLDEVYSLIHKVKPECLIGSNHHIAPLNGEDFQMFEKDLPGANTAGFNTKEIGKLPLETCETMNDHWGFHINDRNFKTSKQIVHYVVNAAGRNTNFLLNVGPMPNGKIQPEFQDTLKVVGQWMAKFGATIYETRGSTIPPQEWGVATQKAKRHYLHILNLPKSSFIFLPNIKEKINAALLFENKKVVKFKQIPEGVFVYIDGLKADALDNVIELQY